MFTSDIALITDPAYRAISENFHKNPDQLAQAFAEAWFKLTTAIWGRSRAIWAARFPMNRASGWTRCRWSITR
jgi:catalase (peroxidase I)